MNLKYEEKSIGEIIVGTLKVTDPMIRKEKRRLFRARCTICNYEKTYRYDSLTQLKGCPSRCQNKPNLSGYTTKYYTVLYPIKGREAFWRCLCACGKEFNRKISHIIKGVVKGCCQKVESPSKRKKGTLERQLLSTYKRSKNAKKLGFTITQEDFNLLIKQSCHYCGSVPKAKFTSIGCVGELIYNGIDRIDNLKGYHTGNVLPCCKICNFAKRDMFFHEFINWLDSIKNYERKKIKI